MTTIYSTATSLQRLDRTVRSMRRSWLRLRSLLATAAEPLTPIATISWLLPMVGRCRPDRAGRDASPHRALPRLDGGPRLGGLDDRPATVDSVRLLPVRPHRRAIPSNPAQYVRRPKAQPSEGHGIDRGELGTFLFTAEHVDHSHAALAVLLGLTACACRRRADQRRGSWLPTRAPHVAHPRQGQQASAYPSGAAGARTIDLAVGERHEGPIICRHDGQRLDRRTAHRWVRSIGKRAGLGSVHPHMFAPGSSWRPWTRESLYAMCKSPLVTPIPARRPSMTAVERTSTATQRTS